MCVNMPVDRLTLNPIELIFFSFTFLKVWFHFLLTYVVFYIKYAIPVFVSLYVFFLGSVSALKFLSVSGFEQFYYDIPWFRFLYASCS